MNKLSSRFGDLLLRISVKRSKHEFFFAVEGNENTPLARKRVFFISTREKVYHRYIRSPE